MMQKQKPRLLSLDVIRVLSVGLVVLFHFGMFVNEYGIYWRPFPVQAGGVFCGSIGVSLFFVLSGATLSYSGAGRPFSLKAYYKKRFLTLFPAFYIAYGAAFLCLFYMTGTIVPQAPKWTFLFTLLGMDGHLSRLIPNYYLVGEWFLGTIILLYLIYPLIAWIVKRYRKKALAAAAFCYLAGVYVYQYPGIPVEWNAAVRIPEMAWGICLMDRYMDTGRLPGRRAMLLALAVLAAALAFPVPGYMIYNITAAGVSAFTLLFAAAGRVKGRRISMAVSWVSRYSYGIFLCHHVVLQQVCIKWKDRGFSTTELACLFLTVLFAIGLAAVLVTKGGEGLAGLISPPPEEGGKLKGE